MATQADRYNRSTYTEARDKALNAVAAADVAEAFLVSTDVEDAIFMTYVPAVEDSFPSPRMGDDPAGERVQLCDKIAGLRAAGLSFSEACQVLDGRQVAR